MKLLTKELKDKFKEYPLGSQDRLGGAAKVIAKFFNPTGHGTWLITEGDIIRDEKGNVEDVEMFGFAYLGEIENAELGYISLSELQSVKIPPFGLTIERDLYYPSNITLSEACKKEFNYVPDYLQVFENQFLLKDSKRFLEFHLSDEGYDFTLYDENKKEIDGGCIEDTSFISERELLDEITNFLDYTEPKVNLDYDNLIQIEDIENYSYKLEKVKEFMEYIENLTSNGDYSLFEIALLIAERGELNHNEIDEDLIDKVKVISEKNDTLFNEDINYDIENIMKDYCNDEIVAEY